MTQTIIALWLDGLTSSQIAARVGLSRSAVLGRLGRAGLLGRMGKPGSGMGAHKLGQAERSRRRRAAV